MTRLITALGLAASTAVTLLALTGTASAEAFVWHANYRADWASTGVTDIYNVCDMSQGVDSPRWTVTNGSYQQQATIVQVSDYHAQVSMHGVTELQGSYPDGTHVTFHSDMNVSEHVNLDPSSFETGELLLDSALVATSTIHSAIHVQGQSYPDGKYEDAVVHATYTPDLKLASLKVEYRDGC